MTAHPWRARALAAALSTLLSMPAWAGPEEDAPLDLPTLIEAVLEAHPDLEAFRAEADAFRSEAAAAFALPDPMVGFGFNDVGSSFSRRQDMMSMREVMVRQRLPWPGKRALRKEVQDLLAEAAHHGREAEAVALVEATVAAYADLWLAVETRRVLDRQRETLVQLVDLAEVRYEALAVSLSDPLRAELALARIEEPFAELAEREATARAVLASLLARPDEALTGAPSPPSFEPIPEAVDDLLVEVDAHPMLAGLTVRQESRLAAARLAEREVWPDVDVGVVYGQRDTGHDMIGLEVMAPLPIFGRDRRAAEAEAARSQGRALASRRAARRNDLVRDVRAAHATALRQTRVISLYEDEILPRARENVDAATAAYESGDVDFLTLLDAQLQVYDHELNLLRARAAQMRALARLNRALGRKTPTA
jgi:outer membrane protein, heavy metal efflux system